jgi:hypothetical protein
MRDRVHFLRKFSLSAIAAFSALSAYASTFTFTPNDGEGDVDDMLDLDHYKYFTWGFKNFAIPAGEHITNVRLSIYNVNNWTADENGEVVYKKDSRGRYIYVNGQKVIDHVIPENWLNVWLLDGVSSTYSSTSGKLKVYDDADGGPDYFANWDSPIPTAAKQAVKIGTYTDWKGGDHGDVVTLNYDFRALGLIDEFEAYVNTGNSFGIGIDPDCHYWNTGVRLVVYTAHTSVPDSGNSLGLLGIGLGLLAMVRRYLRR